MRCLSNVINAMLSAIPNEEENLIAGLKACQDSYHYSAPEVVSLRWHQVANILHDELSDPPFEQEWKQTVYNIWMGK